MTGGIVGWGIGGWGAVGMSLFPLNGSGAGTCGGAGVKAGALSATTVAVPTSHAMPIAAHLRLR